MRKGIFGPLLCLVMFALLLCSTSAPACDQSGSGHAMGMIQTLTPTWSSAPSSMMIRATAPAPTLVSLPMMPVTTATRREVVVSTPIPLPATPPPDTRREVGTFLTPVVYTTPRARDGGGFFSDFYPR